MQTYGLGRLDIALRCVNAFLAPMFLALGAVTGDAPLTAVGTVFFAVVSAQVYTDVRIYRDQKSVSAIMAEIDRANEDVLRQLEEDSGCP